MVFNNISILEVYPQCIKSSITKYRNIYTMLRQPIATPFIHECLNIVYINNNAMETKVFACTRNSYVFSFV